MVGAKDRKAPFFFICDDIVACAETIVNLPAFLSACTANKDECQAAPRKIKAAPLQGADSYFYLKRLSPC
jgi:hypothetical protein